MLALAEETIATGALSLRRCRTCGEEYPSDYVVCPRDSTALGIDRDAEDPMLGIVLAGTFRVARNLGRGGMGRLYEAHHTRLDRRFAVKVLHEAQSRSRDARRRFDREARALSRIRSDYVLDVIDVLPTPDGRTALITARLDGEDLKVRLDRVGTLPLAEAIPIARQVCRGLAAAHAEGVIHRDMKPSNLFLESGADGRVGVKILDFGVAKLEGDAELTRTGAVVGTPAYMAPEQARGSSKADERADIYAVGAVMYRMLTGRAPYRGDEPAQLLASLLHDAPPRPRQLEPSIPVGLEAVIQRAMARDPDDRPADVLELEQELACFDPGGSAETVASTWEPRDGESSTLILPRGSVDRANRIAGRARRARPLGVALAILSALSCGAVASQLFRGIWTLEADAAPFSSSLAWLVAATVAIGAVTAFGRVVAQRWTSAIEILRVDRALGWGLGAGLVTAGVLDVGLSAYAVLEDAQLATDGAGLIVRWLVPLAAAGIASWRGWLKHEG
ncbi:MAG: serine/threonine-protein kinase [Sandaracinaceae bacterium]